MNAMATATAARAQPAAPEPARPDAGRRQTPLAPLHRTFGNRVVARAVAGAPSSPGTPLDGPTRTVMESRFGGTSFGDVRVHADAAASASARSLGAAAYTVGSNVVVDSSRVAPRTRAAQRVMTHELAHVAQQARARGEARELGEPDDALEVEAGAYASGQQMGPVRGAAVEPVVQRVGIGEFFSRLFDEGTFTDAELQQYLTLMGVTNTTEGNYDSDNKARAIVRKWVAGETGYLGLTAQQKAIMVQEMIEGATLAEDEAAILAILFGSSDADLGVILARNPVAVLRDNLDGDSRTQLEEFLLLYQQRTGALPVSDLLAATHVVTAAESARTTSLLIPRSTVVGGVVTPGPAMTGLGPPGADGPFATAMRSALTTYVGSRGASFRALRAGSPVLPVSRTNNIAVAAQTITESHFAPYVRAASRAPADPYHPGTYSLSTIIQDQSTVPITDDGTPGFPGRKGWTGYWMKQDFTGGEAVMNTYNCDLTRTVPDLAEFTRVRNTFAVDAANRTDIDDTIHGWSAEAAGGIVKIQPYSSATTPADIRSMRWDLFTTLIHEMIHVLQHPNFARTWRLVGGAGQEILKEGFADVMRHDLWDGPGNLQGRLATSTYAPVREEVEGASYPYDPTVVTYHTDYGNPYIRARDIVHGSGGIGMANAKAAFFLGHTELLGLGPATPTAGGSLAGVAMYQSTDPANAQTYTVAAGDDYATIRARTGAGVAGIFATDGSVVTAATALTAGMRLQIPGIRYVYALTSDTAESIAMQNGVALAALLRANGLPAATPGTFAFAVGTQVLIPIH